MPLSGTPSYTPPGAPLPKGMSGPAGAGGYTSKPSGFGVGGEIATGPDPAIKYWDMFRGYYQPQFDLINGGVSRGQAKADYMGGYYGGQEQFARQGYNNDLARLGLQDSNTAIDRTTGQTLLANLSRALGYNNQDYTQTLDNINRRLGTDTTATTYDWRDKIQQLSSARIAGGFGTAPGYDIGADQISQGTRNSLQSLNDAALFARQQAELQNNRANLGIENQRVSQQGELSKLDNAFKATGLQRDELKQALDQKLADLGLSRFTSSQQLEELLQSSDAQRRAIGEQITSQLAPYFGVNPQAAKVG